MKRFLLLLMVLALHAPVVRAAPSGTVTITGAVPQSCDIIVTPEAGASNIADISQGDTDRLIATVNENCNDPDGYTVTVAGQNSTDHTGLFEDSVSADTHPFTIKYDGVAVPGGGVVTDAMGPGINLDRVVEISYAADAGLTATTGFTYSEMLTFTISAK